MKNLLIYITLLYAFVSCTTKQTQDNSLIRYDLSQSIKLSDYEEIFSFDDKYPVGITIKDSIAFIIKIKDNTSFIALNVNKKEIVEDFGHHGQGTEDVISPDFIISTDTSDFIFLDDVNAKKMKKINTKKEDRYKIEKFRNYPVAIFPSSNLSLSSNYIVCRKIDISEKNMFYIYNQTDDTIVGIDFFPDIKGVRDKNYYCAVQLALNESENRIIAGMYFLDMFSLYDLTGKRLKTVYFTDNYIPTVNEDRQILDLRQGFSGTSGIYTTNKFCYLFRETTGNNGTVLNIHLIQVDWNGYPVKSYIIPDNDIKGGFCVDEKNRKMYAIKHSITNNNEIFYIIAYSLP
jgi:hypothetical protein